MDRRSEATNMIIDSSNSNLQIAIRLDTKLKSLGIPATIHLVHDEVQVEVIALYSDLVGVLYDDILKELNNERLSFPALTH